MSSFQTWLLRSSSSGKKTILRWTQAPVRPFSRGHTEIKTCSTQVFSRPSAYANECLPQAMYLELNPEKKK